MNWFNTLDCLMTIEDIEITSLDKSFASIYYQYRIDIAIHEAT